VLCSVKWQTGQTMAGIIFTAGMALFHTVQNELQNLLQNSTFRWHFTDYNILNLY
jgi:hypothetical protein